MTDTQVETGDAREARESDRDRRVRQGERELAALLTRLELTLSYEEVVSTQGGKFNRFCFYDAKPAPAPVDPVTADPQKIGPQLVKSDATQ